MTVRTGREFLSIPGPTNVPEAVLSAMHRPAEDIYSAEMLAITMGCLEDLGKIFKTTGGTYIYAANGHGAWEAALTNVLSKGDDILVLESGRFALGWGEMAGVMGIKVEILPGDWCRAVDPAALEHRLREDVNGAIKAVLVVQVDTASGVVNDIVAIRKAMDNAGHGALLMVDAIASLGTMPFEMDGWGIDVAITGSQKGLMMTPGLSFVAANDKARSVHKNADLRTHYWDWTAREGDEHYNKYCGTAPEHMLFGLRKAFDMLLDEGLNAAILRHRLLAEAVRAAVEVWSQGGVLDFNIQAPNQRSNSVTTVLMNGGHDPAPLLNFCKEKCGVVLGIGIGALGGKAFRIAHMGYVNAPMILGTLGVIETALQALQIPHGKGGVQAAIDSLGQSLKA